MRKTLLVLTTCLLLAMSASPVLQAQQAGGAIRGAVADVSGAASPDVTIVLENSTTGQRYSVVTDTGGRFVFNDVPPGRYRIMTTVGQATSAPTQEFDIALNTESTINLTVANVQPGQPAPARATDVITSVEAPTIQLIKAQIFTNYNTNMIEKLPQPNQTMRNGESYNAYNLSLLNEGVTSGGAGFAAGPSVGGTRPMSNNFHIDGIDNNSIANPGPLVQLSEEATTEFALMQSQFTPIFGHSSGGKFNSVIQNGTNEFHGSVYNFLMNKNLNAVDASLARLGFAEYPRYDQNRLGASAGFPIIKNKLFLFGNFEYIPLGFTGFAQNRALAPTAAGFNNLALIPGISTTNLNFLRNNIGSTTDSVTTTTVNGTEIPLGFVNTAVDSWRNQYNGTGALDFHMNQKSSVKFRYMQNYSETERDGISPLPLFPAAPSYRTQLASGAWYYTFGANATNEVRFGWNRDARNFNFGSFSGGALGLNTFPNFSFSDIGLSLGPSVMGPENVANNTYHLADSFAWNPGRHNLRFGFDGRRYIGAFNDFGLARGNFAYSTFERFLRDLNPDVYSAQAFGSTYYEPNQYLITAYVHDNIKLTRNFNLSLGVRWEYATLPESLQRQGLSAAGTVPGLLDIEEFGSDSNNFAPNVGISYVPWLHSVFRAGFGMTYDTIGANRAWTRFTPFLNPQSGTVSYGSLAGSQPGFFTGGGLPNNFTGGDLTDAQIRSGLSTYAGEQTVPYTMHWNAAIQQDLWKNMVAEVKYLGARGVHLRRMGLLNGSAVTSDRNLPLYFEQPSQGELNGLGLSLNDLRNTTNAFGAAGFGNPLFTVFNDGLSRYNALGVTLNQRFTTGFQMVGAWTYSHLSDDSSGTPLDLNMGRVWGDSLYDRRHRLTVTSVWDVAPLFDKYNPIVRNIVSNLTLSGTYTYESPQRLPALSSADAGLTGFGYSPAIYNPAGAGNFASGVTPLTNSAGSTVAYLANNPSARFLSAAPGIFSAARPTFQLDNTNNFDVSAQKRFTFADRYSIVLRGDAYNVLNHPQFTGGPLNDIGFRYSALVPSIMQTGSANFANPRGVFPSNSRILQVALKFAW